MNSSNCLAIKTSSNIKYINGQVFKEFLEIDYQLILPISQNQLHSTFVNAIKFESFLSKRDNCPLEMVQVYKPE